MIRNRALFAPPALRGGYLGDLLTTVFERGLVGVGGAEKRDIHEMCAKLLEAAGENAALALARDILRTYATLSDQEKHRFFQHLSEEYDINPDHVKACAQSYQNSQSREDLSALMAAAEPRRQELFRKLNQAPGATAALVAMRRDVLRLSRQTPAFGRIDLCMRHLFASWFNRGFLVLRAIDWSTPAQVLERIIAYEAVHEINDWDDLRRRVQPPDRRCFAFFHPCMPTDPLIFVEVALTKGIPGAIADVLATEREPLAESEADTAVFYSISNCQKGLKGISFGNALIKQVVADLAQEFPRLSTFVTLSPVPGLRSWLTEQDGAGQEAAAAASAAASASAQSDTLAQSEALSAQDDMLREMAAQYLVLAKDQTGAPLDPVARFHLANGARLHAIHARADLSANGLQRGCGVMVNYLYKIKEVDDLSESYAATRDVARARSIDTLLRSATRSE